MQLRKPRRYHYLALILVVSFALLAGLYSIVTPLWEAPDESGHFRFIQHFLETGRLPEQELGVMIQAHHPPLYYLIAGFFAAPAKLGISSGAYRPNPNFIWAGGDETNVSFHHTEETFPYRGLSLAVHLARAASIFMATITVLLIIAIGWQIFPQQLEIGLLAAALVAFNPQFLFINSSINNDVLLALATTGILWQAIRMWEKTDQLGQWLQLGLWMAIALLAKLSSVVLVTVAIAYLALGAWRGRTWRSFIRGILVTGLVIIMLTGWWFIRNQLLYGDPLGWRIYSQIFAVNFRSDPLTLTEITNFFRVQFRSFWGIFGWMNIRAPVWLYTLAAILVVAGVAGSLIFGVSGKWRQLRNNQRIDLALLAAAVLAQEAFILRAITQFNASWYQGRYLFPAVAPISLLLALGLFTLVRPLTHSLRSLLLGGLALIMVSVALLMPLKVIAPAYETPSLPKSSLWFLPNRSDVIFGDQIVLRSYQVETDPAESSLTLTLTWQAQKRPDFDYSAFVHLVDDAGQLLAQDDGPPGATGGYPPLAWQPEDIVRDQRKVMLPSDAAPPLTLRVGLYNWHDGQRLPAVSAAGPIGDAVIIQLQDP